MLYNDIFNLIKQNSFTTLKQLEIALSLDQGTIMIVLEKLVQANKIININKRLTCCTTKKNCTNCTSLMQKDYYVVCQ